jgi:DNA-binding PadR family transcriptional regulator
MATSDQDPANYLERAAMAAVRGDPNYQASPRMLGRLLNKGWIEKTEDGSGREYFQITCAGRAAIKARVRIY